MKEAAANWEETREERVELFGGDEDEIEDGMIVWYIDKKEEYDRQAAA